MNTTDYLKNLTSILAAIFALLYVSAYVHCIVFFDSFAPDLRTQLTFLDVVNHATYTSTGPILLIIITALAEYLSLYVQNLKRF
jgi:thiamine transporter ThiT